jgi:hypothetical protein
MQQQKTQVRTATQMEVRNMRQMKIRNGLIKGVGICLIGWLLTSQAIGYETRTVQAETMRVISGSAAPTPLFWYGNVGRFGMWIWLGGSSPSTASLSVSIRSLPPGRYRIFMRIPEANDSVNCTVGLGNSEWGPPPTQVSFSLGACMRAGDVYQAPVEISTTQARDLLILQLALASGSTRLAVDWILITDDPTIVIRNNPCDTSRSEFVRVSDPPTPRLIPVGTTNAFPNSSFEAGDVYWQGGYQWDYQIFSSMIDNTRAYHGQRSLKIIMFRERNNPSNSSPPYTIVFKGNSFGSPELGGFEVQAGRTYTFSFWVYHQNPGGVRVTASINYTNLDCCSGCSSPSSNSMSVLPGSWTQVWVSAAVPDSYGRTVATVSFEVSTNANNPTDMLPVWIDAMQFHEGSSPLPYQPARAMEAGLRFAEPGNVVIDGYENSQIRLYAWKESAAVRGYFEYYVYDFFNRLVASNIVDLSGLPAGSHDLPVVSDLPRGWFEVHYRTVIEGQPLPEFSRIHFTVVPPATGDTLIGGYGVTGPIALRIYDLSALRWQNLYSASNFIQYWDRVEPSNDTWNLYVNRIQWARDQGINLIFTFATGSAASSTVPCWAVRGTVTVADCASPVFVASCTCSGCSPEPYNPNLHIWHRTSGNQGEYFRIEDWQDYVRTMVRTYRFWIKYWQVIDEPMNGFCPAEYLKLLKATYQAAKAEDPNAIILASPHYPYAASWGRELFTLDVDGDSIPDLSQYCDGIYDYVGHDRPYAYFVRLWAMLNRKKLLAVEYFFMRSGWYDLLKGTNYPSDIGNFKGYTLRTLREVAVNALQSLTWSGAERYLVYDMRFPGALGWATCFEPDGTWKPSGSLLACMSAILANYVGVDELGTGGDTLRVFWFRSRSGSTSLFAVISTGASPWEPKGELRWITLPSASFTALDAFGNPAPRNGNRVLIGGLPTYIIVSRANETLFKRALIQQSLAKPERAYQVIGSWFEWRRNHFVLVTRVRNNTPWPFYGDAYVFPHWETNSTYHLYNYDPVYSRSWYANTAIVRDIAIGPGGVVDIEFPLEYGYDAPYKNPALNLYYPLYFWLVPSGSTILPFGEVQTSLFWFGSSF